VRAVALVVSFGSAIIGLVGWLLIQSAWLLGASAMLAVGIALPLGIVMFQGDRRRSSIPPSWPSTQVALNSLFEGRAAIKSLDLHEPYLEKLGSLEPTPEIMKRAQVFARKLGGQTDKSDEVVGILQNPEDLSRTPAVLRFKTARYSVVQALREARRAPCVLTGNAIITCSRSTSVFVHLRGSHTDTFPNHLHVFGGSYHETISSHDRLSLWRTATREIREEADPVEIPRRMPCMLSLELGDKPFVQLTFLGVDAPPDAIQPGPRQEGHVYEWKFNDLSKRLVEGDWVPSGRMAFLAWLALGAPTSAGPGFDSKLATRMYHDAVQSLLALNRSAQ
jgi:hypothetical protein